MSDLISLKLDLNINDAHIKPIFDISDSDLLDSLTSSDPKSPNFIEPILDPKNYKFTVFPITYPKIWSRYKEQIACFWKAEEIDFSNDYDDFMSLNTDEQNFIKMILAFFAASDGIVNFGIGERFLSEVKITEALVMYQFQTMMENIHGETYSLQLDNIVRNKNEKEKLFNAIHEIKSVKTMADWAFDRIKNTPSFGEFLVANACVEGIFFSGAFAAIFWLKKYKNSNKSKNTQFMNGLITSNKFISRDEGLHYEAAVDIYNELKVKVPSDKIEEIVKSAVNIAQEFMIDSLKINLIGMNSKMMCDYIEYIGDRTLVMFGNEKVYNKTNPFKFMETIGATDKSNFFEVRPHEYQAAHSTNTKTNMDDVLDEDDF
jgi:ribonucleotide reductase beta subunit family protein with ferritin-like domain